MKTIVGVYDFPRDVVKDYDKATYLETIKVPALEVDVDVYAGKEWTYAFPKEWGTRQVSSDMVVAFSGNLTPKEVIAELRKMYKE